VRKLPSIVFCGVTMLLFIGPALLSTGVPAWPQKRGSRTPADERNDEDPATFRDRQFAFEIRLPGQPGWSFAESDPENPEQRVIIVHELPEAAGPSEFVEVSVYAFEAPAGVGSPAELLPQVEAAIEEFYDEKPPFHTDRSARFAGQKAIRVETRGPSRHLAPKKLESRAHVFKRRSTFFIYLVHAEEGAIARFQKPLQQIERGFKLL
jgi:hypothetical protein